MRLTHEELTIVQFALRDYIKELKKLPSQGEGLAEEAIDLFLKINRDRMESGREHYLRPFGELGLSEADRRNWILRKGGTR